MPSMSMRLCWSRFRRNRPGYRSLWIFFGLVALSLCTIFIANDRPLLVRFDGKYFAPVFIDYPDSAFGGEFGMVAADFRDADLQKLIAAKSGTIVWAPIRFSYDTFNVDIPTPAPSPPTWMLSASDCRPVAEAKGRTSCRDLPQNWLGTDEAAHDVAARAMHGVRFAVEIGLGVACAALLIGLAAGAAARRTLPDATTMTIRALPSIFCWSIAALIALDFAGYGVPPGWPSLGELLRQAKTNAEAPWIAVGGLIGLGVVAALCILGRFIRRGLRDAFDAALAHPRAR